jgi:signal transduction histidine kinase
VRAVRSLTAQHDLEIQYQYSGGELLFRGDENLIQRMILNLFDNAIKYTPNGGRIDVTLWRDEVNYSIRIADTGTGIPVAAQPHIFERFYRADKARSRDGETGGSSGAGLGLSIAVWSAEMHGGYIALEHSDHNGSAFMIFLPAPSGPAPD